MDRLAAATMNKDGVLTGRTVTPALTVSLLQKATSSSVLPSDSSGLQSPLMCCAKAGPTHATTVWMTDKGHDIVADTGVE